MGLERRYAGVQDEERNVIVKGLLLKVVRFTRFSVVIHILK